MVRTKDCDKSRSPFLVSKNINSQKLRQQNRTIRLIMESQRRLTPSSLLLLHSFSNHLLAHPYFDLSFLYFRLRST